MSCSRLTAIAAALTLAACTQTVMVNPANQDAPTPPVRHSSGSTAPTHEVQAGDTLYKISVQYGVDYRDLAAWNNIAAPYTIYPRQRLRVGNEATASPPAASPSNATTAPLAASAATPPVSPSSAGTAAPAAISATPAATATPAAAAASAADQPHAEGYNAELGVTLPAGAMPIASSTAPASNSAPVFEPTTPGASASAPSAAPGTSATSMPAAEAPLPEVSPSAAPAPAAAAAAAAPTAAATTGADVASSKPSAAGWIWPTPGKVVGTYASGDPMRQGIDIVGDFGQPVRAARDGEVVYSGAGLIGYGELVIIKHSPELLSAYGHNRVRLVKEGDKIKAGQKIAEMGKNAANRVLLHFEVRKGGKPVDPLPLLPAR